MHSELPQAIPQMALIPAKGEELIGSAHHILLIQRLCRKAILGKTFFDLPVVLLAFRTCETPVS